MVRASSDLPISDGMFYNTPAMFGGSEEEKRCGGQTGK